MNHYPRHIGDLFAFPKHEIRLIAYFLSFFLVASQRINQRRDIVGMNKDKTLLPDMAGLLDHNKTMMRGVHLSCLSTFDNQHISSLSGEME